MNKKKLLTLIPAVNDFLKSEKGIDLIDKYSRQQFLNSLREELNEIREKILSTDFNLENFDKNKLKMNFIIDKIKLNLETEKNQALNKLINASGVIIHTNLGRSILAESAANKVFEVAKNYSNLEYDLEKAERGSRYKRLNSLVKDLTGAEAAVVVNNNAAAVMLILSTLAQDKEVIIARGEMVEIGGSFRIPEVMENSGAILREVGTTNKVYLDDYLNAINENTAAIIKVNTSNYQVCGFTHEVKAAEIVEAAHQKKVPVISDLGSGIIYDLTEYGLPTESTVKAEVEAGVDLLCFSGDKILGGPQAGIIVGREKYIEKIATNPLLRALRVDKMTIAALEETLKLYYNFSNALKEIPTLKSLVENSAEIKTRAEHLKNIISNDYANKLKIKIIETQAKIGGGAYPLTNFASYGLEFEFKEDIIEEFNAKLRQLKQPVIARIQANKLIFDLKTVKNSQLEALAAAIITTLNEVF